jgi:hypothetical protein
VRRFDQHHGESLRWGAGAQSGFLTLRIPQFDAPAAWKRTV